MPGQPKIIIEGITEDGKPFRPSDWMERISGSLSQFGDDRRMHYAPDLQPQVIDGAKCLVVDPALQHGNPGAFAFLMDFVRSNHLRVHDTRGQTARDEKPGAAVPVAA